MKSLKLPIGIICLLLFVTSCTKNDQFKPFEEENSNQQSIAKRAATGLDYGLYWFDGNGQSLSGFNHSTGQVENVPSNYYSNHKPTIIHFHGWQPNSDERESFQLTNSSLNVDVNTMEAWKAQGWNVGVFYWDQFANEAEVKDAEAKIWSANGPRGMRYRKSDGSYANSSSLNVSVSQMAFEQVAAVLQNNSSGNFRLSGHSLGNQLALNVAHLLDENGHSQLVPKRIELLDPFWSKSAKSYLGDENGDGNDDWTGERCRWYGRELINNHNTAVTWYRSSAILDLGIGDQNTSFESDVALVQLRLWYLNGFDIANKHVYVRHHYFWSMAFDPPVECTISWWQRKSTGKDGASASTSDSRIREMMGDRYLWDQVEGRYTVSPQDDWSERKSY